MSEMVGNWKNVVSHEALQMFMVLICSLKKTK